MTLSRLFGLRKPIFLHLGVLLILISTLSAIQASEDLKTRFCNEFMLAISQKQTDRARQLLQDYPVVAKALDGDGQPVILMAVNQCPELVEAMVKAGADPNYSQAGCPILYMVSSSANPALKALLKAGADPNRTEPSGASPVHLAIANGDLDAVKLMVEYGLDLNIKYDGRSLKEFAKQKGQKHIEEWLEQAKPGKPVIAKVEEKTPAVEEKSSTDLPAGNTSVSREIFSEEWVKALTDANLSVVTALIEKGADLNTPVNCVGWAMPPLIKIMYEANSSMSGNQNDPERVRQAWENRLPIALMLLEKGADANVQVGIEKGAPSWPALHWAVIEAFDRPEIMEKLLERGARPYIPQNEQSTMEFFSIHAEEYLRGKPELWARYMKIFAEIVRRTGAPDLEMTGKNTLIHKFAGTKCPPGDFGLLKAMSDTLFDCGAKVDPQLTESLTTPLHIAVCSPETASYALYLIDRKANVNAKDKNGETPLFWLAKSYSGKEQLRIGSKLLKNGADLHASYYLHPDNTILHVSNRYIELFSLFKKNGGTCKFQGIDSKTPCEDCRKASANKVNLGNSDENEKEETSDYILEASAEPDQIWANCIPEKGAKAKLKSLFKISVTTSKGKPASGIGIAINSPSNYHYLGATSLTADTQGKAVTECGAGSAGIMNFEILVGPKGKPSKTLTVKVGGLELRCTEKGKSVLLLDGKTPVEFETTLADPSGKGVEGAEICLEVDETKIAGKGQIKPAKGKSDSNGKCIFSYIPPLAKPGNLKGGYVTFKAIARIQKKMTLSSAAPVKLTPNAGYNMLVMVNKDGYEEAKPFNVVCTGESGSVEGVIKTAGADGAMVPVAYAEVWMKRPDGAKLIGGTRQETDGEGRFKVAFASQINDSGDVLQLNEPLVLTVAPEVTNHLKNAKEKLEEIKQRNVSAPKLDEFIQKFPSLLAASNVLHGENRASSKELVAAAALTDQLTTHVAILDEKARQSMEAFLYDISVAVKNLSETWELADQISEQAESFANKSKDFISGNVEKLRSAIPQLDAALNKLEADCRKLKLDMLKYLIESVFDSAQTIWLEFDNRLKDAKVMGYDLEEIHNSKIKDKGDYIFKTWEKIGSEVDDGLQKLILDYFSEIASSGHELLISKVLERYASLAIEGRLFWGDPKRSIDLSHDQAVAAYNRHQEVFSKDYKQETTAAWLELSKILPAGLEAFYFMHPKNPASKKNMEKLCKKVEESENIEDMLKPFADGSDMTNKIYGHMGAVLRIIKSRKFLYDISDMQGTMVDIAMTISKSIGKD
ncbi:MAG: ankyrin repeat domain-containing protein [Candidatus Riflebacteria bacterium]|nr:ankyrin repeat domain-containing protein [Candidatus Riflebacteria bacterium]